MSVTNSVLYSYLLNLDACQDALDFVATQSTNDAVDNNARGNYFIWLARKTSAFTNNQILRMKVDCLSNANDLPEIYVNAFLAAQVYLENPSDQNLNLMKTAHDLAYSNYIEDQGNQDKFTRFGALVASDLGSFDATSEGYASRNDLNCAESIKTLYSSNFKNFLNSNTLVTQNLVRHLDAGIPFSLVSQNSTQWIDLVNDEGHNIIDGSYNSENRGSIVFNGSSTYIDISIPVSSSSNYTKEAWVRLSTSDGSRNIISSESDVFWINNGTLYGGLDSQYFIVSSSSFPVNTWKHVVLTFNDSTNTMTLYIDGVQVDQNTQVVGSYQGQTLRVGAHFSEGSPISFWEGRISSVRVYSKELSSSEVSRNYNSSYLRYQTNIIPTTTLPPSPEGESPTPSETPTNTPTVTPTQTPTNTPTPTTTPSGGGIVPFILRIDTTRGGQNPGLAESNLVFVDDLYYDFIVDWGDAQTESIMGLGSQIVGGNGRLSHYYSEPGLYDIQIFSNLPFALQTLNDNNSIKYNGKEWREIVQWGNCVWYTLRGAFGYMVDLQITATDTPNLSQCLSFQSAFFGCENLTGGNIGSWNIGSSPATSFRDMFYSCSNFNANLNNWNVSNGVDFFMMFFFATSFNSPLNNWNVCNATEMNWMLRNTAFDQDISSWKVPLILEEPANFCLFSPFCSDPSKKPQWGVSC